MTTPLGAPRQAIVVADPDDRDAGHVGERLRQHGFALRDVLRPLLQDGATDYLAHADLVLLLGSADAVYDPTRAAAVDAESVLVRRALDRGVPVLAICYGAQLAAHALGGSVRPVERGEVGWVAVESSDDALCGPGPWLQFHSDVLTPPPGARTTGSTACGPQGFVVDRAEGRAGLVAWQFHPEVTAMTLERWITGMRDYVRQHGGDPDQLLAQTRQREDASRVAAGRLVDAAFAHLAVPSAAPTLPA